MSTLNLLFRNRQPELMDQPMLDESVHRKALLGIKRINEISRIGRSLWQEIDRVIMERNLKKVRVLDLACGGGDIAIYLARLGASRQINFSIDGSDISKTAVMHAKAQAHSTSTGNVHFFESDALRSSLNEDTNKEYDIVMCSLFLHHLKENQVVSLLQKMAVTARHAIIIDDLRRTSFGYGLAWLGCRLLTRSPMVRVDGPLSVQGAFTVEEARSLTQRAGLHNVQIVKHWPQRFLMTWRKE